MEMKLTILPHSVNNYFLVVWQMLFPPWRKDFRADSLHGHTKRLYASPMLARPKRRNRSPRRLWRSLRPATPLSSQDAFGF